LSQRPEAGADERQLYGIFLEVNLLSTPAGSPSNAAWNFFGKKAKDSLPKSLTHKAAAHAAPRKRHRALGASRHYHFYSVTGSIP